MKAKFLFFLISVLIVLTNHAFAIPASGGNIQVTQGGNSTFSGNQFSVRLYGDEYFNWYETETGYIVGQDNTGKWLYMTSDSGGLTLTNNDVTSANPPSTVVRRDLPSSTFFQALKSTKVGELNVTSSASANASINQLVLLVSFADHWDSSGNSVSTTHAPSTDAGYYTTNLLTPTKNYFTEVSGGNLTLNSTISNWIKLPHNESYYGIDSSTSVDVNAHLMVQDAFDIIASSNSSYTGLTISGNTINNLFMNLVTLVHSGHEQAHIAFSTSTNSIWAHHRYLSSSANIGNTGIQFPKYATVAALGGQSGTLYPSVGTLCHELGHAFGLPDLYEYSESGYGIGNWGLMGYGAWGASGNIETANRPVHLSAWSKVKLGFVTPTTLEYSQDTIILDNVELSNLPIYKLQGGQSSEYFLLENRSTSSGSFNQDISTYASPGILIWHVYEASFSSNSSLWTHPILKLEEADGNDSLGLGNKKIEAGDVWKKGQTLSSFSDSIVSSTSSNSNLYENTHYYLRTAATSGTKNLLDNFSASSTRMTFDIQTNKVKMFIASSTDFSNGKVSWYSAYNATSYQLERRIGSGSWSTITLSTALSTSYTDSDINSTTHAGQLFSYRVTAQPHNVVGELFDFGLKVKSASLDFDKRLLSLTFNTSVDISSTTNVSLNNVSILNNDGTTIFPLSGTTLTTDLPGEYTDTNTTFTLGTSTEILNLTLSIPQIYEVIRLTSPTHNGLKLSVGSSSFQIAGADIKNIAQTGSQAVDITAIPDTKKPSLISSTAKNTDQLIELIFDEAILESSLNLSQIFVNDSSNANNQSSLENSTVSYSGNKVTIELDDTRLTRMLILQQQSGTFSVSVNDSFKDLSQNLNNTSSNFTTSITPDTTQPFIESFSLNNRDEIRKLTLVFNEPIYPSTNFTQTAFDLNDFSVNIYQTSGASAIGTPTTIVGSSFQISPTIDSFLGSSVQITTQVTLTLLESEILPVDTTLGLMVNPAPTAAATLVGGAQSFVDRSNNLPNQGKVTLTSNYIPKSRLWISNPIGGNGEIWRGTHLLTWNINGGWYKQDRIIVEWYNSITQTTSVINASKEFTETSPGSLEFHTEQTQLWDTTKEIDRKEYFIRLLSTDRSIVYSSSSSFEVDNTRPSVEISYLSTNIPSHRTNATSVYENSTLPVTSSQKANIVIVATYSEPLIFTPQLNINQPGSIDIQNSDGTGVYMTTAAGSSANVFFYPYDVQTQDGKNYLDGLSTILLNQVPDRAVGDIRVSTASSDLLGNLNLDPTSNTTFLIDTIPPTIASLDFRITNESIVNRPSTLILNFSESMDSFGLPLTGVLNRTNYSLSGAESEGLRVDKIEGTGTGPYLVTLTGRIRRGTLTLTIDRRGVRDFHNNLMGIPNSASATWPGPLTNTHQVLVSPGGRTRLLLTGGYPPYTIKVDPFYAPIASMASDNKSILAYQLGLYTISVTESRQQTRYVNTEVQPIYINKGNKQMNAYRDELDYRLVSFPFNVPNWDGDGLFKLLSTDVGEFAKDYALFHYKESVSASGYAAITLNTTEVGPGYGFWMASRKKRDIPMQASGPLPKQVVGIDLHHGWNIIGNPFETEISVDQIYVSTDANRYPISDQRQSETGHHLWYIDIDLPEYVSLKTLAPFTGAWLYVENPKGAEIFFFKESENVLFPQDFEPRARAKQQLKVRHANTTKGEPLPPGRPSASSFLSSSTGSSGSGGGGGGCFIKGELF